jgi:hypothetical protein
MAPARVSGEELVGLLLKELRLVLGEMQIGLEEF